MLVRQNVCPLSETSHSNEKCVCNHFVLFHTLHNFRFETCAAYFPPNIYPFIILRVLGLISDDVRILPTRAACQWLWTYVWDLTPLHVSTRSPPVIITLCMKVLHISKNIKLMYYLLVIHRFYAHKYRLISTTTPCLQ
jgi:hypothetical protein